MKKLVASKRSIRLNGLQRASASDALKIHHATCGDRWSGLRHLTIAAAAAMALAAMPASSAFAGNAKGLFSHTPGDLAQTADVTQSKHLERIKKDKTTANVKLVHIDVDALAGDSVQIPVNPTRVLTYTKTKIESVGPTSFVWYGTLPEMQGTAILVVNNGKITGTVRDNGAMYKIESVGNGKHAFIEIDHAGFPADHPQQTADRRTKPPSGGGVTPTPILPPPPTPTPIPAGPSQIDVMVVYPPSILSVTGDVNGLIALAVAETNQAYANSGVNIKMNLVAATQINYVEDGKTFLTMLSDLANNAAVAQQRTAVGADVVVMLTTHSDYCGYGYVGPSAGSAYSVVHSGCATGHYSFAHEIGHNMGLDHDPLNASPGVATYAHGYQSTSSSPSWRTIMAYNCSPGCPRLQYFSNPNLNYNGLAMGTPSTSDNARRLNETAAAVSAYRTRPAP